MDNYSNQLYDFLIANSDDNFRNSFPTYGDFEKRIKDTAYVSNLYSFLYDRSDDNFRQSFPDVVSFNDRLKKKEVSSKDSAEDSSDPKRVLETDLQRGRLSADALGDISSVLSLTDRYGEVSEKGFENVYPDVVIPQEGEDVIIDGVNISGLEQIVKKQASEFGSPAAGQLQRKELEIQDEDILNFARSSKAGLSKSDFLVKELANVSDVVNRNYKAAGGQGSLIEMDGSTAVGINRNALNYSMLSSDYFQKEMMKEQAEGIARTLAMQMTPAGGQYIISRQLLGGAEGLGAGVYAWFDSEGAQNYLLKKSARDTGFKQALGLSQEQIEKGIIENFSEGDIEAGMTNLFLTGLEQVPQLALMSVAPNLGMATLAVSAGGQQYSSLMVNPDVSKGAAVTSGIFLGAAEAMTERIFQSDVNQLRRAFTMSKYGSVKEIFKNKSVLKNLRGFGMSFVKSGSEEALEEGIVGVLEQVTNAYIAGESINLYEIADAAAVGFAMGGNTRLVTGLPSFIGSMQTTKQLTKINNEIKKAEDLLSKAQGPYAKQVANERIRQLREQAAKILVSDAEFYDQMTDEELAEITAINQKIAQAKMQYSQADSEAEAEVARGVMESELAKKQEIENRYGSKKEGEVPSAEQTGETVKQALPEQERSPEQIEADRVSSEEVDNIFGQDRSLNNVSERAGRKERINEQEIEDAINDGYAMLDEIEANDNLSEQDKATMSELIEDQIETLEGYELQTKTETRKVAKTKTVRTVKKTPRKTEPTREKEFVGAKAVYSDNEGGGGRGVVTKEEGPDGKNYYIIETADGQKILLGEESTLFNETTINRDENGNPVSITTPVGKDGKQVTIKNPEVAETFDIEQGKQEEFDEQIFEETYIEVVGEEDVEVLSPRPKPTPRPKPQPKKTESEQKAEEKVEEAQEEAKEEVKEEAVKPTNIDDMSQTEIEKFIRDNAGPVGKLLLRAIRNVKNTVGVLGYEVIMVSRNKMGELEGSNPMEASVGQIDTKAKKIYINVQDGADLAGKIEGDSEEVRAAFREYQEKAIVRGVYHEAFHALFINAFGENPAMLKPFVATLSRAIRASLSQEMANEVVGKLNTFVEQYEGDNTKLDEFITELAAIMTTSRVNADEDPIILKYPTLAGRIRNIFNNFFARIGSDFRFTSDDDIIAFMNSAARGLEAGTRATTILEENERLLKDRFVAQAQGSVGPIRKSKRSEADEILLETVETQIKTGPDNIDYAPDGVYVNIGMIEGRTNKKVSQEQVFNALPDNIIDEYVFVPVEERHEDGGDLVYEDTLIFRLKRPLTDEEMLSLRQELFQFAVPQIVDGDAVMFGRDFGPFDPQYFIMLDKKRLLDSDPSTRKSKRVELDAVSESPSNIDQAFEMAKTTAASVNVEFKDELQDIFNTQTKRIMAQEYGVKDFSTAKGNEPLKRYLVDAYLAEVLAAVKNYPQALGWYDAKTKAAMDIMSTIHPELATDVDALNLFKIAVAITSNGNKVDQNFKEADRVYRYYKENGEFDTKKSLGTQSSAIKASFRLVNRALQKMTVAEFTEFLTTKMQAGELSYRAKDGKKGKLVDGHTVNTEVYGASIFGPKIGNGFFMNLYGAYEMLTMDRWFIRTYGRLTGTLIQRDKAAIQGARVRLKNSLQALSVAERKVLRDVIGPYSKLNLSEIARLINSKSTKEDLRAVISKGKLNEVRLAGNGLVTKEKGEVEAPRGGNNRNFIKSVFDEVQQRLKDENDLDITMADIQAVIWYPEKALYEEYKKGKKVDKKSNESKDKDAEQPDYENAAEKLAKEFNITQKQIDDARGSKPTGKLDGRRAGQRGGDDARKAQVKEEIIKAKAGNKFDRLLEEAKTRKSKRVGLTTLEGRGKQITTTLNENRPIGVIPVPERYMKGFNERPLTEKEKNSPLYEIGQKFPYKKGGVYVDARDKSSPMDSYVASSGKIFIDLKSGFPKMGVSENEVDRAVGVRESKKAGREGTRLIKTNLFRKGTWDWKQASRGLKENVKTIISVDTGGHHIYALSFESTTPLELKNYGNEKSEPRLKPTTAGAIFLGTQVGEIKIGSRVHPVFEQVISYDPNDPSIVERLAYSQSKSDQEFNQQYYDRFKQKPLRNPTDDLFKDVDKYVLKTLGFEGAKHIGNGVEANVYDIGGGRVIRISNFPSPLLNSLAGKSIDGLVKVYSTGRVEFPKNLIAKSIPRFIKEDKERAEQIKRRQQQMKRLPVGYYSIMKKESTEGVSDEIKDLFFKIGDFLSMRGFRTGYTFTDSLFRPRSKWQLETRPELQLNEEEMQELRESLTEQQAKDLDRFLQIDKNARAAGIQLYDTHSGNFARDSEGSLVALDLDTALKGEIKAEEKTVVRKAKRVTKSFDRATEKRTEGHAQDLITNLDKKRNKLRGIALIRNYFFDRQGVVRKLIRESGNKMLLASLSTRNGSSAHAKKLFDEKAKDIFEGVFGNKLKYLSEIIMLRRIVSIEDGIPLKIDKVMQKIDDEKARKNPRASELTKLKKELYNLQNFKHPRNHTRQSAMDKMDEIRQRINDDDQFFDLRNRADKYFDVMRFVLKRKYDNGLIDKETYDALANYEYSPRIFIDKMFDVEAGNFDQKERTFMKGYGLSEAEFKKLKAGSAEDLFSDAEFLMRMVLATSESRIFSNRLYKELANSTNLKWVSDTDLDGFREVKYKDNGEVKSIFVRADLADQIEYPDDGVSKSEMNRIGQWVLGSKILRAMATGYNPLFPIANVPMDFMNIIFFTDVYDNKNVFHAMALLSKQFLRNAAGLRTKNPNTMANLKEALEAGMGMDYLTNQGRLEFDKKSKSKRQKFWKDGADIVKSFSENSEMAMRLSVYNKVKEEELAKGATQEEARTFAAYKARATIDFSQGGTISKSVDSLVPYFNASLQALRVAGEYTTGKETRGTFVKKIAQAGTAVTMLTILGRMLAEAGDWDEEDEMAISQHDKDNYFIIRLPFVEDKNGDKMYIRIRKNPQLAPFLKPFEWGGNAIYDAFNGATDEDIIQSGKKAFAEMVNQINDATIFGDTFFEIDEKTLEPKISAAGLAQYTPPVAKGILQYLSGYDYFRERNISPDKMMVDMGQIGMGQEGMFDPSVVEFYKKAAKVAEGTPLEFSPARMQNLVQTIITSPSTNIMVAFAYGMLDLDLSEIPKLAGQRAVRSAVKGYSRVTLDPEFIKENQAYNAAQNKIRYEIGQMVNVDEATPAELDAYIDGIEDPELRDFAKKRRRFNVRKSRFKGSIIQNKAKYIELDSYLRDRPKYAAQWMYREIGDISNNDLVEIAGYIKDMRGSSSFTYPPEFIREYRRLQQEARK